MVDGTVKEGLFENNIYRGNGKVTNNSVDMSSDFVIEEDFDGEMNESMTKSKGIFND